MSSRTENEDPNNSSLSVVSVDSDLNGVNVTCTDGNFNVVGSGDICVTGKIKMLKEELQMQLTCYTLFNHSISTHIN